MDKNKPFILAIDDQASILHALIAELKELYDVAAIRSGNSALMLLTKRDVDLILLDYDMPEMNGLEVLMRLRQNDRTSGIPVIFLTSSEDRNIETEVLENGASDYIHKPINAHVLRTRVRLQLELKRYQNHLEALVEEKTVHLQQANEKLKAREDITLSLLAEATDMRDHDTGSHILRTTGMVRLLVTFLMENPVPGYEISQTEADDIINSAKLHDLGKIAIPDRILLKQGKLDDDEMEIVRLHPLNGAALFDKYSNQDGEDTFLHTARDIALSHHEKWNGTGYPHGLSGVNIPLSGRITAIADVYDALTSERPYKKPFSHEQSVEIIEEDSGTHFDPYLVSVFLALREDFRRISSMNGS